MLPPPDPYISGEEDDCAPEDYLSTMSTTVALRAGSREPPSNGRLKDLKIGPLPTSGEPLWEWVLSLKWSLAGNCFCHNGIHATGIKFTTESMKSLSNDLLSVLKKAVTEHSSTSNQRNAHSLLQDNINRVNGIALISQGKGFEMYHLQEIKSRFSCGLRTEAISHLTEYFLAVQQSQEFVGSFFGRMHQLEAIRPSTDHKRV
jgi:hypothetical protein